MAPWSTAGTRNSRGRQELYTSELLIVMRQERSHRLLPREPAGIDAQDTTFDDLHTRYTRVGSRTLGAKE